MCSLLQLPQLPLVLRQRFWFGGISLCFRGTLLVLRHYLWFRGVNCGFEASILSNHASGQNVVVPVEDDLFGRQCECVSATAAPLVQRTSFEQPCQHQEGS